MGDATARGVIAATVLGSGMAMLDGTVVNVALRTIGEDLDASLAQLQWITNGYLLSLASLILLGGSLGDRFGRRRVFVVGTVWFALASVLCGLAPTPEVLIAARVLQGVGAALLTPGSLAMIQGAFRVRGPGAGDRRVVGARQHRRGDRAVRRRPARRLGVAGDGSSCSTSRSPCSRWRSPGASSRRPATRTRPSTSTWPGRRWSTLALAG